jgi:hypothetical protein
MKIVGAELFIAKVNETEPNLLMWYEQFHLFSFIRMHQVHDLNIVFKPVNSHLNPWNFVYNHQIPHNLSLKICTKLVVC